MSENITISTQSNSADVSIKSRDIEVPTHERIRQSNRNEIKSLRKRLEKSMRKKMEEAVDVSDQDFKDEVVDPKDLKGLGSRSCVKNEGR